MSIVKISHTDVFNLYGKDPDSDYTLSFHGALVGAIELTGIDPSGTGKSSYPVISDILARLIQSLPFNVQTEQYYLHAENQKIILRQRENERSNKLSRTRQAFMNKKRRLNRSRLVWIICVEPDFRYNGIMSLDFVRYLFNALFDRHSRDNLKKILSSRDDILLDYDALVLQKNCLDDVLSLINAQLQFNSAENIIYRQPELWKLQKFLSTFNSDYLTGNSFVTPPDEWDAFVLDGDTLDVVEYKGVNLLRIGGDKPVYVRFASVTRFGNDSVPFCVWTHGDKSPVLARGNYVYYMKYKSFSGVQKETQLKFKSDELTRETLRLKDFLFSQTSGEQIEGRIRENENLRKLMQELESERFSEFKSGRCQAGIAVYSTDKDEVITLSREIKNRMASDIHLVWESVATLEAYRAIQPATPKFSYRAFSMNSYQAGAASLIFRSQIGNNEWQTDLNKKDEAFYILESDDGVPFYFCPKISEKLLIIGNGATRSGKTFLAKTIASHFAKFNGIYAAIDIDPGSVPMANFFGEMAGKFELDSASQQGFNLFSTAKSMNDMEFISHLLAMLLMMCKFNEDEESRTFTLEEQNQIRQAIINTLEDHFNDEIKYQATLTGMVIRLGERTRAKLANFYGQGVYSRIFDCKTDSIGFMDKPLSVYNLADVKDSENNKINDDTVSVAQLVHAEILYRIVSIFESPKYRTTPKLLEIDEAHYTFSVPSTARFAINKAKTWFKHGGGMAVWTQSPSHYYNLPDWPTLRSSASVFIFTADREGTDEDYRRTYGLSDDEINIIRGLKQKQQIYIKIPDLNINKVVSLFVESEQYAICTSRAEESDMAFRVWQEARNNHIPVDEAVSTIVTRLGMPLTQPESEEEAEEARYYA